MVYSVMQMVVKDELEKSLGCMEIQDWIGQKWKLQKT